MLDSLISFFGINKIPTEQLTILATIASIIAAFTSLISLIGIIFAFKSHILKSKTKFTGYLKVTKCYNNSEEFVSYLTLDNLRDRSEVIYGIYLEIDYGKYICLEDLKDRPIVIPPFDVIVREFGFVDFYHIVGQRVNIRHFLDTNRRVKIVLSISSGKYRFTPSIDFWTPEKDRYFNESVHSITCSRLEFDGKYYANDLLYLIVEKSEATPIYNIDVREGRFREFDIGDECLVSKESFEIYLKSLEHNEGKEFYILDKNDLTNKMIGRSGEMFIPYIGPYEVYIWYKIKGHLSRLSKKIRNYIR